nr:MAG TPA: hypothetical protein [Caudoviricetes sp.]
MSSFLRARQGFIMISETIIIPFAHKKSRNPNLIS